MAAGITHVRGKLPGPRGRKLLERWHRFEADVVGYQAPVVWKRARGCVIEDVDGNKFIDWTSGVLVTNVGHCHPRLVKAVRDASGKLLNNYECANEYRIQAAEALVKALPPHLNRCFFLSTGSEAIEAAVRLLKRKTGKYEILSFDGSFHGRTVTAASLGGLPGPKSRYGPLMPGAIRVPFPHPYRDPQGWCDDAPRFDKYFYFLESAVASNSTGSLGGVITEPYQGTAGFLFPPRGWLKRLEEWACSRGLLFVLDEVQSSFGRTGKMWAMDHEGLKPDIVILGKGIGSGVPVSAVASTAEIFSALSKGEMSSTMGGNPVSSAAVLAVLDIMRRERLAENAMRIGDFMIDRLRRIAVRSPYLGDVRGMGLVMGVEFVLDKKSKEPARELVREVINRCARNGLLVGAVGTHQHILRVAPPLVIDRKEADESLSIFERVVKGL